MVLLLVVETQVKNIMVLLKDLLYLNSILLHLTNVLRTVLLIKYVHLL